MVSQEEQEGWDFRKFQEEVLIDFSLFEGEFLAQSTLDDHAQQQQHLELELTLDDIIGSLDDELTGQLEPPIPPPPPPRVDQQVNGNVAASETSSNPKKRRMRRSRKISPEEIKLRAMAKEMQKIKNRETAAKKQKYVKDLDLQYEDLYKENTISKRILKFLEISMEVGTLPRKLAHTTSGPIPSYLPIVI